MPGAPSRTAPAAVFAARRVPVYRLNRMVTDRTDGECRRKIVPNQAWCGLRRKPHDLSGLSRTGRSWV